MRVHYYIGQWNFAGRFKVVKEYRNLGSALNDYDFFNKKPRGFAEFKYDLYDHEGYELLKMNEELIN